MIFYQRRGLRYAEFYFEEPETEVKADIASYVQRSRPVPHSESTSFATRVLDLKSSPDELLADMSRQTRHTIRRSARNDFRHSVVSTPGPEAIDSFCDVQDEFARWKNLPTVDRVYYRILSEAGLLQLSFIHGGDASPLAWKSYLVTGGRARIMHGGAVRVMPGAECARLGAASSVNTVSLWQDVLHFQKAGCTCFDLGGWYSGTTDAQLLRVNDFKRRFGGRVVDEFKCVRALNAKGKVALSARSAIHRWRDYMKGMRLSGVPTQEICE